jgi:hypothetical protein
MITNRLDSRAVQRVSGPSWQAMRPTFNALSDALLGVSPTTRGELTTIYIKYVCTESNNQPYAVIWIKKANEVTVGLALPEEIDSSCFVAAPPKCKYAGLTRFLVLRQGDTIPADFTFWAEKAYHHVRSR